MRKVLFVVKNSALNRGMSTGIENLAWKIAGQGVDVEVLSGGNEPEVPKLDAPSAVRYHFSGGDGKPNDLLRAYVRLSRGSSFSFVIGWIKNIAPIAHWCRQRDGSRPLFIANQGITDKPQYDAGVLRFPSRLRKILKIFYSVSAGFPSLFRYAVYPEKLHRNVDLVVANSGAVRRNAETVYGIPSERCRVIHRSIDTNMYRAAASGKSSVSAPMYLLHSGIVDDRKGVHDVVGALCQLEIPVKYVLCGPAKPAYLERMRKQLASSGRPHEIIFEGVVNPSDLVNRYRGADVFCLCSYTEGFSKSLLEAMASGLPVIVSDIDPFKEIVVDGINGLMVKLGCSASIADAIRRFSYDNALRMSCASAARATVEERFDAAVEVRAWMKVFDEYTPSV